MTQSTHWSSDLDKNWWKKDVFYRLETEEIGLESINKAWRQDFPLILSIAIIIYACKIFSLIYPHVINSFYLYFLYFLSIFSIISSNNAIFCYIFPAHFAIFSLQFIPLQTVHCESMKKSPSKSPRYICHNRRQNVIKKWYIVVIIAKELTSLIVYFIYVFKAENRITNNKAASNKRKFRRFSVFFELALVERWLSR